MVIEKRIDLPLRLSTHHLDAEQRVLLGWNLGGAVLGVALAVGLVYLLLGPLLRPVGEVERALGELSRGELGTRLSTARLGPLAGVGAAVNRLGETYGAARPPSAGTVAMWRILPN